MLGSTVYQWMQWQEPYWFLLLIPLSIGIFFRIQRYYVKKAFGHLPIRGRGRMLWTRIRFTLPSSAALAALVFLVAALGDVTRTYVAVSEKAGKHRIFVWVDSSSSMYGFSTTLGSITCAKNADLFPRIHGACRALSWVITLVEKHSSQKANPPEKDLIGIGQFATYSYVVAYPSEDYDRLREKVNAMEFYSRDILGIYTNVHLGLWDLYLLALNRNIQKREGFTVVDEKELRLLAKSLQPESIHTSYIAPRELREKFLRIKEELRDTVFIFFTDALENQMNNVMNVPPYSLRKQMQLAALLEVPVIFLSTDEYHPGLKELARRTGFGPLGGKYRGDFFVIQKEHDFGQIEKLVENILEARFSLTVPLLTERRESYAEVCAVAALFFFGLALLLRKTIARSLTDI